MGQPHKHAELIKLWADGAEIQRYSPVNGWTDIITYPDWDSFCEKFRIKPKTIKYRLYLDSYNRVQAITHGEGILCHFVKWLGDWQEVVVE